MTEQISSSQRILLALKQARIQLETLEREKNEPIAIIGMDCRFPGGANNPEAYWQLLAKGVDAIREIPPERWDIQAYYDQDPEAKGKMYTLSGGFIDTVDQFEPQFFGISPREAISLDPQQRLLLEVSYHALEQAGQSPEQLKGSPTGVFMGIGFEDYGKRSVSSGDPTLIDAFSSLGNHRSIAVGRMAYVLGLQGPVVQLDTTCSSSLLAVHLACQSLRSQECNLALAGGVNVILSPEPTIGFCKLKALSLDGRCKTFDAQADGYGRGEGCGIVVLKRLSQAIANRDNILGLILGSAVNHDGQSNGLTAPNGSAQETVILQALNNAKIDASQVQYVETHGTGTPLGDPIEVLALGRVFKGKRSKDNPLMIGAVKTNFGHLEAAAGVASLLKVIVSLQHKHIPSHLHFNQPNPHIPWEKLAIAVPTQLTPWSNENGQRIAGVSSFGMSGTNVHLIVAEAPIQSLSESEMERPLHLLTLSAKSQKALQELVQKYLDVLREDQPLADICYTANTGRSHFEHRLAIIARDSKQLREKLQAFDVFSGSLQKQPKIAFLFTGQGSQYVGMGQELYETQPTFKRFLDRCGEILKPYLDIPLIEILQSPELQGQTAYTQPALFALEYSLAQLWMSWGIIPGVVIGHSVGEYVAACIAGVFSLEDGLKLIAHRGRLMQELPQDGAMVAIMAPLETVQEAIASSQVVIAAINSPQNTVISGQLQAIESVILNLEQKGIKTTRLNVSHGFHSPLMEPMQDAFSVITQSINYAIPQIPLVSNISGTLATEEIATPEYWCHHVCLPVQFSQGIATVIQEECEIFVEIGSKPILLGMVSAQENQKSYLYLPSLRPNQSDWQTLLSAIANLYINGVKINWSAFDQDYSRQRLSLPTYPFQRQKYWLEYPQILLTKASHQHPLLGQELKLANSKTIHFDSHISQDSPGFLKDHSVFAKVIFPAAGYLEMALAAGKSRLENQPFHIEFIRIIQALELDNLSKNVQLKLTPEKDNNYAFEIYSFNRDWVLNAEGKITVSSKIVSANILDIKQKLSELTPVNNFYQRYQEKGINYGKSFQVIKNIWVGKSEAIGEIQLLETNPIYHFHPLLLDACLQIAGATLIDESLTNTYLPVRLERFLIDKYPGKLTQFYAHAKVRSPRVARKARSLQPTLTIDIQLIEPDGQIIATFESLQLSPVQLPKKDLQDSLYQIDWRLENIIPNQLSTPAIISNHLQPELTIESELEEYQQLLAQLESVSVNHILQAFTELGYEFKPGTTFTTLEIAQELKIINRHQRLFSRLLEILAEEKIIGKVGDCWEVINPVKQASIFHPSKESVELRLLNHCGSHLAEVLQGKCDPIDLLFSQGDLTLTTELYQNSVGARLMNTLVQKTVLKALENKSLGQKIKILEIGAGTGGTTSYLLPYLDSVSNEYVFTDISPLFTVKAQQKFDSYSFIKYKTLDIDKTPESQGFNLGEYDLVIAANVIHATQDLQKTLSHIQKLLKSQGLLILLEGTHPLCWLDLTFGLTEGWWRFTDTQIRPSYPLISFNQWQELLTTTGFKETTALAFEQKLLEQQKVIIAQNEANSDVSNWLIFADTQGFGEKLAAKGDSCTLVFEHQEVNLALQSETYENIVYLWGLDAPDAKDLSVETLTVNAKKLGESLLHLIQSLSKSCTIWLVTRGTVSVQENDKPSSLVQSILWGMGKAIAIEYPDFNCKRIDLDSEANVDEQIATLQKEIQADTQEEQIAFRDGNRYLARLVRYSQPFLTQLTISQRGTIENLQIQPLTRCSPQIGEVEIKIHATGLNFRDVLNVLDLYPGDAGLLGCECVGEIVAVGEDVKDFTIGQAVMTIATGSFADYVTVNASLVVPKPENLSFAEAATIPVAFSTAYYTLQHLAGIKQGDSVLIHAAAGGVGMAAVQIALQAGAEVFATASPSKWDTLKAMGVKHIFNSRTLDFADEITAITEGKGVDIVLNSFAEEYILKSLLILKETGIFIEIGKNKVQVEQIKPNISYFLVDMVELCQTQPQLIQSLLQQLRLQFAEKTLQPLPYQSFPLTEAVSAWRTMQQAKHIGKIIITPQNSESPYRGTYLITGGLGDLGLLVADWLITKGVEKVVLVSRNPANSQIQLGENILVKQADVSQPAQIAQVIAEIEAELPPLKGVIHSAGVLDDGTLAKMSWSRFETVMAPKVQGGWNLHILTKDKALDRFILFSSAASLLGSPGQGNHVTANYFLDSLAQYRKYLGLPGLSINWGVWASIGAAARQKVSFKGIGAIEPEEGLAILEKLMSESVTQVGVIPIDWSEFPPISPFFADFSGESRTKSPETSEILKIPPEEQRDYLTTYVNSQIAQVLGMSPSEIDTQTGFFDLGMDSLTAVEFRNLLQNHLNIRLPSTVAFDYPNVKTLVDYLTAEVLKVTPVSEEKTENLADLSEEEIADLLTQELLGIEQEKQR